MSPYYQDVSDTPLLDEYITTYTYPECAASALWFELGGRVGMQMDGVQKIDTGAEKFVYSEPGTMQLACERQGKYFGERCDMVMGHGSAAIKTSKASVGGITEEFGSNDE